MPHILCNTRAGMDVALKAKLAAEITDLVHETIKSPMNVISVIFNDLPSESSYVAGKPGNETIIICNIRFGRSEGAKQALSMGISAIWHRLTRQSQDHIEVAVQEFQARFVTRGGEIMPEPPYA